MSISTGIVTALRSHGDDVRHVLRSNGASADDIAEYDRVIQVVRSKQLFKIGDKIADIPIVQIRNGANGKVAIVGRRMAGHVEKVAADLELKGHNVEIFNEEYQGEFRFFIDGEPKRWKDLSDDFTDKSKYVRNDKKWIMDESLPDTYMYKANKQWAQKLVDEGYTVIDVGYPHDLNSSSVFYDMEIQILFNK